MKCTKCDKKVLSNSVEGAVDPDKRYRAWCNCTGVNGRSEKRARKSFKHFNKANLVEE